MEQTGNTFDLEKQAFSANWFYQKDSCKNHSVLKLLQFYNSITQSKKSAKLISLRKFCDLFITIQKKNLKFQVLSFCSLNELWWGWLGLSRESFGANYVRVLKCGNPQGRKKSLIRYSLYRYTRWNNFYGDVSYVYLNKITPQKLFHRVLYRVKSIRKPCLGYQEKKKKLFMLKIVTRKDRIKRRLQIFI